MYAIVNRSGIGRGIHFLRNGHMGNYGLDITFPLG